MVQNRKQFPSLTGLKAVMCLIVMFYHTMPSTPLINAIPLSSMIRYMGGHLGNSIFFMISGFLMVNAYRDRIRNGSISFGTFLYQKIAKFYGLYLLTNALAMILRILRYGLSSVNLHDVAMILLLQKGGLIQGEYPYNGATWFVSMLIVCNMVFFALCTLAKSRSAYGCALAGVILWGYIALTHDYEFPLVHTLMGVGLVNFFLGCAIAEVYPCIRRDTHRWLSRVALLALAGAGVLMLKNGVDNALGIPLAGIAFGLSPMILYASVECPLLSRPLGSRPMKALGKISISIFFWHMVLSDAVLQLKACFTGTEDLTDLQYLGYLLLMLAVSFLSYRYLEKGFVPKKTSGIPESSRP